MKEGCLSILFLDALGSFMHFLFLQVVLFKLPNVKYRGSHFNVKVLKV
jgi:hypothetical protein